MLRRSKDWISFELLPSSTRTCDILYVIISSKELMYERTVDSVPIFRLTLTIKMLKGVVGLVTGGASGLGKATVERIVRQGGKVRN